MRRNYRATLLIISILFCQTAGAQIDYGFSLLGRVLPGEADAAFTLGNICYQGAGDMLQAYDVDNISAPTLQGQLDLAGQVEDIFVQGGLAYIADDFGGLVIADVSSPARMLTLGSLTFDDAAFGLDVTGNYAYVACLLAGLKIVDVSVPSAPQQLSSFPVDWSAINVDMAGNLAAVSCGYGGLYFVNVSNPFAPLQVSLVDTHNTWVYDAKIGGNYAYMAYALYEGGGGLKVINIATPSNPQVVGDLPLSITPVRMDYSGNYVYMATEGNGLMIVDVGNPATPRIVGGWHNGFGKNICYRDSVIYLAGGEEGLRILGAANPQLPQLVSSCPTFSSSQDVTVVGHYAYLIEKPSGFRVIDLSNLGAPRTLYSRYFFWENGKYQGVGEGVSIIGNYMYLLNDADFYGGEDDFRIFNLAGNPIQPESLGVYGLNVSPRGHKIRDDIAYVATGQTMKVLDVRDPGNIELLNSFQGDWHSASGMDMVGNYIYLGTTNTGLRIIDITNEDTPVIVGSLETNGRAYSARYHNGYVFVADDTCGLRVIDVTSPANPVELASFTGYEDCADVAFIDNTSGSYAIALFDDQVVALDINNPVDPIEVGYYGTNDPHHLITRGDTIYVADRDNGLHILLLGHGVAVDRDPAASLPERPILVRNYPNPFNSSTMIEFTLPEGGKATVEIFDIAGRKITGLANGVFTPGLHRVIWDGRDGAGRGLAGGIYFYRVAAGERRGGGSMVLIK